MLQLEKELEERYASLRDSRDGPVFFIEHGLDEGDVDSLMAEVRGHASTYVLDSPWWRMRRLSVVVAATEIGYRYRGAGTDFWPELSRELGTEVGDTARHAIRDMFVDAATSFRGAHPPGTPWAQAFHLIAWPITHALLPLEFHRPLAQALASLRVNISEMDEASCHRAIRVAAATRPSARFATLLEDASLIVPIAKSLLGSKSVGLCQETTQRIADDLKADHIARRSVAAARRVQRTSPTRTQRRSTADPVIESVQGSLQLRRRGEVFSLEASFPTLPPELLSRLRGVLRRRRYAPRLWGVTSRVPSEQLLSGLPFPLRLASTPDEDAPLIPGLDELEIRDEMRHALAAFALDVSPPLLFAVGADNDIGRHVRGPSVSGHRNYWALTAQPSPLADIAPICEVGPFACHTLDPARESALAALAELGFNVRFGVSVGFAGSPAHEPNASTPAFSVGDVRVVVPRRAYPDGLQVELDGSRAQVGQDELVRVVVPAGPHTLRVSTSTESRDYAFQGVSPPPSLPTAVCGIEARSAELTVQALLSGSLSFSIQSYAPLEGLDLTAEVEAGGRRVSATASLPPLPQLLTSKHEPFASLLHDETSPARQLLLRAPSARLNLRVGCIAASSWDLDHRLRPCWWIRHPDGRVDLRSEEGQLAFGLVAATDPYLPPSPDLERADLDLFLYAPVDLGAVDFGATAQFSTLCAAKETGTYQAFRPDVLKPRLVRRLCTTSEGSAGLETLVEAYLRWSLAECASTLAELRRHQIASELDSWIAEVCCGAIWCRRELEVPRHDPWDLLAEQGHERALGRDSYHDLPDNVWREALEDAVDEIRRELPELWSLARPPCDLDRRDWLMIEAACDSAYVRLGRRYRISGDDGIADCLEGADASADFDTRAWEEVLELISCQSDLTMLAALLLPSDSASRFVSLDPTSMTLDELSEELASWANMNRRALAGDAPTAATFKAILALWSEPELAVSLPWREGLEVLVADRPVARAARYIAMRRRLGSSERRARKT